MTMQPATPRRVGGIVLAALIGLIVGAAAVSGVWWLTADKSQPPTAVAVGLDRLPSTFAGAERDDRAAEAKKAGQGQPMRDHWERMAPALTTAYGGAAAEASYGLLDGPNHVQVQVANAVLPAPLTVSDDFLAITGFLGGQYAVEVPGTATTRCVASPGSTGLVIRAKLPATSADVAKLKKELTDGSDGRVTCVRADAARHFSVQAVSEARGRTGAPLGTQAAQLAAAVDQLWTSLAAT